jgi:hypothetical protein
MNCSKGHLVSGDNCKICGEVLKEKKAPVTNIKRVSDKRAKEEREYLKLNKRFLKDNPNCAVFPALKSNQIHHKKGRIGNLLTDVRYFLAVSDQGHKEIEMNPIWAIKNGFSVLRLTEDNKITI